MSFFKVCSLFSVTAVCSQHARCIFTKPYCESTDTIAREDSKPPGSKTTETNIYYSIIESTHLVKSFILKHYICMKRYALLCACACMYAAVAAQSKPIVLHITASASETDGEISVRWQMDKQSTQSVSRLLVFRSTDGIIKTIDENAVPHAVLSAGSTEYRDKVSDTSSTYYYAVIAEQSDGSAYNIVIPSVNATLTGVTLALSAQPLTTNDEKELFTEPSPVPVKTPVTLRKRPLPRLNILPNIVPEQNAYPKSGEIQSNYNAYDISTDENIKADILEQEKNDELLSGDDYTLFAIINERFTPKDWENAEKDLRRFLHINRSEEVNARAFFYLGQALYFNGKYRQALECFQNSQRFFPVLSKKWSERALDRYRTE